jgi:hypothetical protein
MQMQASMQTLYAEFQSLKYEVSVVNQNMHQMKQTLAVIKSSVDALCQRSGIIVTPTYPLQ